MGKKLTLIWAEKYAILLKCRSMGIRGQLEGIRKVQCWAVETLDLKSQPSYSTIRRIVDNEEIVTRWMDSVGYRRKKVWCTRNNALDEQLRQWVVLIWERGVYITGAVIQEKSVN